MIRPADDRASHADTGGTSLTDIVTALDFELQHATIPDYGGAVNGLQVANRGRVHRVAVAVDASLQTIEAAAAANADLLVVHHGLFWGGVQPLTGVAYRKYAALFASDIAVYASHLPLDLHAAHGNNVNLARALELTPSAGFARYKTVDIGVQGEADIATSELFDRVAAFAGQYGGHTRSSVPLEGRRTKRWAICSGGAGSSETIEQAIAAGIDTLVTGEGPHHATVASIEHDLCIIFAGHYATETLGVQAIGAWLESRFDLPYTFLHLPTGS